MAARPLPPSYPADWLEGPQDKRTKVDGWKVLAWAAKSVFCHECLFKQLILLSCSHQHSCLLSCCPIYPKPTNLSGYGRPHQSSHHRNIPSFSKFLYHLPELLTLSITCSYQKTLLKLVYTDSMRSSNHREDRKFLRQSLSLSLSEYSWGVTRDTYVETYCFHPCP